MTRLLFSGLACCVLLTADFSAPAWRYRRPLTVTLPGPVAEFTVDAALFHDSAANLDDLRILRGDIETPYLILTLNGSRQTVEPAATVINKAFVPGTGVQAILDLKAHPEHNRLRIATPLHNFKESVRVETSDDARTWALVQSAGLIFDVTREDHPASETTVSYPTSTRRYVRLTIPGWKEPANLESVWLSAYKETGATRDVIATLTPTVQEDAKTQTSEVTVDLAFSGQPFDRIDLTVDPGLFLRTVEIAATNDPLHWYPISGGVISRTADGEQLSLSVGETTDRYLKITVFNADSAPLHFGAITLSGIRRIVKFSSAQPGAYFIYIGNPSARQPSYDFVHVVPSGGVPSAAKLGITTANPLFRLPDRPWTDRNPWLLNGALVVAVVAMGFVTLRMLKKVS
jgi:hypothetical protein